MDGPRTPTAIHSPPDLKFHPSEKANAIADCLEIQFMPHDLCDDNHEWRVEATVNALLEIVDTSAPQWISPGDLKEINKFLEIEKGLWN
jgi:hypothetical protein